MKHTLTRYGVILGLFALVTLPVSAQDGSPSENEARGDYYFKAGYYLKASEHYRLALLEDPADPRKKLAFGHALFAIGNYSYASYALRRGVSELDDPDFATDVEALFPSENAFEQALRDLKRYVTYSPRDPAGLTVLGYVLFTKGDEEERCRDMFVYLQRLDQTDPFAEYFLEQLEARSGVDREPTEPLVEAPEPEPEPVPESEPEPVPVPVVEPEPAPEPNLVELIPEPERRGERATGVEPEPEPALSE